MIYILKYNRLSYFYKGRAIYSGFFLGAFSGMEKINSAIEYYCTCPGFRDDPDCFEINPIHLDPTDGVIYESSYSYMGKDESEDVDAYLGYFLNEEEAYDNVSEWKADMEDDYNDDDFTVDKIEIDRLYWEEGFDTEIIGEE